MCMALMCDMTQNYRKQMYASEDSIKLYPIGHY